MKRIISLILICVIAFSFVSCGNDEKEQREVELLLNGIWYTSNSSSGVTAIADFDNGKYYFTTYSKNGDKLYEAEGDYTIDTREKRIVASDRTFEYIYNGETLKMFSSGNTYLKYNG